MPNKDYIRHATMHYLGEAESFVGKLTPNELKLGPKSKGRKLG